ncbi:MAG: hypothetical protein ABF649_14065 [Bacillus sp. (in: firmicutes)]
MKSKNTSISFSCFLGSVAVFILSYIIGATYGETGFKISEGNGWIGYVLLAILFALPLVGLIFGFKVLKCHLLLLIEMSLRKDSKKEQNWI